MSGAATGRRARLLLLALCLGLCGVIFLETRGDPIGAAAYATTPPPRKPASIRPAPASFVMPPLRAYAEVTARPLFSRTRRPPVASATATDASGFTLIGIVISSSERHALVEHGRPPHLERIGEGQELEGWTAEQILPDRVVLRRGDTRVDLKAREKPRAPSSPRRAPGPPAVSPVVRLGPRVSFSARGVLDRGTKAVALPLPDR